MKTYGDYIKNAKIIKLSELPKIGELDHEHFEEYSGIVFSVNALEDWDNEEYIFFDVGYGERLKDKTLEEFTHGVDTYHFTYAIKVSDFVKEAPGNVGNDKRLL